MTFGALLLRHRKTAGLSHAASRGERGAYQRHLRDSLAACERWDTDATREIAAEVRKCLTDEGDRRQRRTVLRNASASNRSVPGGTSR